MRASCLALLGVARVRHGEERREGGERRLRPARLERLNQIGAARHHSTRGADHFDRPGVDPGYVRNGAARNVFHGNPSDTFQEVAQPVDELPVRDESDPASRKVGEQMGFDRVMQPDRLSGGGNEAEPAPRSTAGAR